VLEIYVYDEDWLKDDLIAKASYTALGLTQTKGETVHFMKDAKGRILAELSLECSWNPILKNINIAPTVIPPTLEEESSNESLQEDIEEDNNSTTPTGEKGRKSDVKIPVRKTLIDMGTQNRRKIGVLQK